MLIETLVVGPLQVNCFVVGCPQTRQAIVIDPGDEGERILEAIKAAGLDLKLVVNTHGHFDHIGANRFLVEATGADLAIHEHGVPTMQRASAHASVYGLTAVPSPEPTRLLNDGDTIEVGSLSLEVIHVPGHSPGGIGLYGGGHLFSGDCLFAGSIGRTDLPGGDHDALLRGIRTRLLTLPGKTIVHTGHGPDTTIKREKASNPFVGDNA